MSADTVDGLDHRPSAGLGPALVGGLIGAAIGIALDVVLETGMLTKRPYEASWFAIVIGVLTGMGVRWANKHHMERSYARGAVSAAIALVAIVLSTYLISQVMSRRDAAAATTPITGKVVTDADADNAQAGDKAATEAAAPEQPAPGANDGRGAMTGQIGRPRGPRDLNPWQFVFMALGALVAYELGRGIDRARRADRPDGALGEPAPIATDPSN